VATNREVSAVLAQAALAAREATSLLLMHPATCDLPEGGRTQEVVDQALLRLQQAQDTLLGEARALLRHPEAE